MEAERRVGNSCMPTRSVSMDLCQLICVNGSVLMDLCQWINNFEPK